jgi:hypothetical protein
MNLWNIVVPALILAFIIRRQLEPRAVREDEPFRLLVVLVALGTVEMVQLAQKHTVPASAWAILGVSLAIGVGLGALRGALVHVWRVDGVLTRQGSYVTLVLWVVGLAVHFGADLVIAQVSHPARDLGNDALLLYVALVLGAQRWVTLARARRIEREPVAA